MKLKQKPTEFLSPRKTVWKSLPHILCRVLKALSKFRNSCTVSNVALDIIFHGAYVWDCMNRNSVYYTIFFYKLSVLWVISLGFLYIFLHSRLNCYLKLAAVIHFSQKNFQKTSLIARYVPFRPKLSGISDLFPFSIVFFHPLHSLFSILSSIWNLMFSLSLYAFFLLLLFFLSPACLPSNSSISLLSVLFLFSLLNVLPHRVGRTWNKIASSSICSLHVRLA